MTGPSHESPTSSWPGGLGTEPPGARPGGGHAGGTCTLTSLPPCRRAGSGPHRDPFSWGPGLGVWPGPLTRPEGGEAWWPQLWSLQETMAVFLESPGQRGSEPVSTHASQPSPSPTRTPSAQCLEEEAVLSATEMPLVPGLGPEGAPALLAGAWGPRPAVSGPVAGSLVFSWILLPAGPRSL